MDPCNLLASHMCPAARWFSQEKSPFVSFLKAGALVRASSRLALLDMETQEQVSTWECPDSCLDCEAGLDLGLIWIIVSELNSWRWKTKCVAAPDQTSLQELFVVRFPMWPCPAAVAASKRPAAATCRWLQPSPDQQHVGMYWDETANCSCGRLCICALQGCRA